MIISKPCKGWSRDWRLCHPSRKKISKMLKCKWYRTAPNFCFGWNAWSCRSFVTRKGWRLRGRPKGFEDYERSKNLLISFFVLEVERIAKIKRQIKKPYTKNKPSKAGEFIFSFSGNVNMNKKTERANIKETLSCHV